MTPSDLLKQLRVVNAASPFNAWAGFELVAAADGNAVLTMTARVEVLQHSGFLHAGVLGALIDTACGFAAASVSGAVLASQYQVLCYRPAVGEYFEARARVTRAGKRQVFAAADVFAVNQTGELLVGAGNAILIVSMA